MPVTEATVGLFSTSLPLTQLVPAFGGGDALMREPEFARALANSNPIKVLTGESARIWAAYRKAGGAVIQSIGGALRPLL